MKPLFATLTISAVASLVIAATPSKDTTRILRKGRYRIEVTTTMRSGDWYGWWGAANDFPGPSRIVKAVRAYRGADRLFVPVSAFAGLADAHTIWLQATKGGVEMRIVGADAGEAWKGVFRFDREGLVERRIRSGELPDIDYERTIYRRPRPGEID